MNLDVPVSDERRIEVVANGPRRPAVGSRLLVNVRRRSWDSSRCCKKAREKKIKSRCVAADVARVAAASPRSWVHSLEAELLHMGVSHPGNWGIGRGASHSLSSGGGCASFSLACQRLVLNSSPRHRDFTRLCSSAAAPQFAPIGVWSACVSCSCSLLGMGPLWPSPFLRWAQCPSSRQLHQTFRWGRRSGSPAAMALQHHCSWRCARRQTPS